MSFIKSLIHSIFGKKEEKKPSQIVIREIKTSNPHPKPAKPAHKPQPAASTSLRKPAPKSAERTERPERAERTERKPAPKPIRKPALNTPLIEDFVPEAWDADAHLPEAAEGKSRFTDIGIIPPLLRGIYDTGFTHCTAIQAQIMPHSLKGLDVTGRAQTGTGKTAAFLLTILQRLTLNKPVQPRKYGAPRALIMAPTRELVMQIEKDARELGAHTGARILAVFGGMDYDKQRDALESDYVDIVIATPGRILDYYKQRAIYMDRVEILVLDEADRMLDMGFLPDMRKIINAIPAKNDRQTMLFSATLTPEIATLAALWTNDPIKVEVEPEQVTSANIEQIAYIVSKDGKFPLLYNLLSKTYSGRVIIFANRKDQVRRLHERLEACGFTSGMLTGDVTQPRRIKTLEALRSGKINILVATDVAGRGIHVENVEAVFNYTLPDDPDDYVHRIGRTGRAGSKGVSIAFASEEDSYVLPNIEAYIKEALNYITPDDELMAPLPEEMLAKIKARKRSSGSSRPMDRTRKFRK
ncbi:MAG: DEAD/DEAH box helicase [Deferribacteraceae bacterium]|jgi:ATP-dependent RNA helicase RhlB|nr:DEAD/DEAH box helicase [Deferribacteraceae bacterium]